jgi:alkanesulfonate monooxygenase
MPIEFVGMIGTREASELDGPPAWIRGGEIDLQYVKDFAQAHERGGFDKTLIGYYSTGAEGFQIASYAARWTDRLGLLVAHRPGFVAPTLAARTAATADQLTGGRITLNVVTGGSDQDQQSEGDWAGHDERYRRTDEYLTILNKAWTSPEAFDHEGEFYRIKGYRPGVRPVSGGPIPIYFGGASDAAVRAGAPHADVYMFWAETLALTKDRIAAVRSEAARHGRNPRISVSFRPILATTEDLAWEKAHSYLERVRSARKGVKSPASFSVGSMGSQRLLELAEQGEVHDKRLYTAIAKEVGAQGNTTALVGTPEQVAESLLDYYEAGVTTILIRGFEPMKDAIAYGRDLIPLVRAEVAGRERQAVA